MDLVRAHDDLLRPERALYRRLAAVALMALAGSLASAATAPDDIAEWQRLRTASGHFSGAAWNDEVDRWDGAKHRLMRKLATRLVARRAGVAEVRARLGTPDEMLLPADTAQARAREALSQPCAGGLTVRATDALWLYDWRGRHDRLALVLRRGQVVACGWLLAWE